MNFDQLDRKMRIFETAHDLCALPGMHIVARLDGRGFTRLTKQTPTFEAPFDVRFRTNKHRLKYIPIITLCSMPGGATTFEAIEEFADCRKQWFQSFLALPNGIPGHDTIDRVFCPLDASVFAQCFG